MQQLTVAEFNRLHHQRMAEFVRNNCEHSDEWDNTNLWFLDYNLGRAYGEIEETKDNHPAFMLEWHPFVGPHFIPSF